VKISDILDNMDLSRIPEDLLSERDYERMDRYGNALAFLLMD
jgi:hypothetical protein